MLSMSVEERRRRLVRRHRLAPPAYAKSVVEAVESVLVPHASDPATVYLRPGRGAPDGVVGWGERGDV